MLLLTIEPENHCVLFWLILASIFSFKFNSFTKGRIGSSPSNLSDFGSERKFQNNTRWKVRQLTDKADLSRRVGKLVFIV